MFFLSLGYSTKDPPNSTTTSFSTRSFAKIPDPDIGTSKSLNFQQQVWLKKNLSGYVLLRTVTKDVPEDDAIRVREFWKHT
jgi:hypothetical protein